jgi:RNA polymerase primary sigma factor
MSSPIYFLERSMLKHDLLSKDREQVLANSILRAADVRQRLEPLIEERRQQKLLKQNRASDSRDGAESDDDGTEGDDVSLSELSVYGVGSYEEDEQFQAMQQRSWLASKERRLRTQEDSNRLPTDPKSILGTTSYLADSLDLHLLTNIDVKSVGIVGGFEELEAILLEASLARQLLISSNIRLVVSIAKKWAKQTARESYASASLSAVYGGGWDRPSLDEVVQEGVIGLSRAVDRFDPKRNLRFSTYATFWITNSVRQCFQKASSGPIRLPLPYYDTKRRYMLLLKKYSNMGKSAPGLEMLAKDLGTTAERLARVLLLTEHPLSTDMPFMRSPTGAAGKAGGGDVENSLTISETLIDAGELSMEERVDLSFLRESLESAMASELAPHERDILRLRLGLDDGISRSVPEVVREFDSRVTASEVRSIEQRAYKKLRSLRVLRAFIAHLDLAGVDRTTVTIR